jgi:hypothetical protein
MLDIREIANQIDPPAVYWIEPDDSGEDFCKECAEARLSALPEATLSYDPCPQSDGCRHCTDCGKLLSYYLTDAGMYAEREHFLEHGVGWPLDPEEAYHVVALEDAMAASGVAWNESN